MSDNPYQSPASTQFADFSGDGADLRMRRLGWFVWTILILDSFSCVLRGSGVAYNIIVQVAVFHFFPIGAWCWLPWGSVLIMAVCALSGNILILSKRRAGVPLAVAGLLLAVIADGINSICGDIILVRLMLARHETPLQIDTTVAALLIIVGWLILYGLAVRTAARRLSGGRDRMWKNFLASECRVKQSHRQM